MRAPLGDTSKAKGRHEQLLRVGSRDAPPPLVPLRACFEGPLADAPNLYCTPHSAWYSPESRAEMRRKGAEAALRALAQPAQLAGAALGEVLRNVVNQEALRRHAHARIPTT